MTEQQEPEKIAPPQQEGMSRKKALLFGLLALWAAIMLFLILDGLAPGETSSLTSSMAR